MESSSVRPPICTDRNKLTSGAASVRVSAQLRTASPLRRSCGTVNPSAAAQACSSRAFLSSSVSSASMFASRYAHCSATLARSVSPCRNSAFTMRLFLIRQSSIVSSVPSCLFIAAATLSHAGMRDPDVWRSLESEEEQLVGLCPDVGERGSGLAVRACEVLCTLPRRAPWHRLRHL